MLSQIFRNYITIVLLTIYFILASWWLKIQFLGTFFDQEVFYFNWSYGLIPFIAALYGIFSVAKEWGSLKSAVGRGLIFISAGLLSQWFGLQIWTYYNIIAQIEVPYPSLADFGYFALVPFYALGAYEFAKASGGKFSLRKANSKVFLTATFIVLSLFAYLLFIKNLGFDLTNPLKTFLDYAYPVGGIIPVTIAIFILTLSKRFLGGSMRSRVLLLTFAFVLQLITEYAFLYAVSIDAYANGGINDLLYIKSYLLMSIGLISFKSYDS